MIVLEKLVFLFISIALSFSYFKISGQLLKNKIKGSSKEVLSCLNQRGVISFTLISIFLIMTWSSLVLKNYIQIKKCEGIVRNIKGNALVEESIWTLILIKLILFFIKMQKGI